MTTSNNLKLSKSLFRSFLRWNRRSHILQSKFSIDMIGIGLSQYLPDNYSSLISNNEGIQGAIFHCFRNHPKDEIIKKNITINQISLGFKILRDLNDVSEELLKRYEARKQRLDIEELSKVDSTISIPFRIGQVVQHKKYKLRGVVTGWEYDKTKNIQLIDILIDTVDISPYAVFTNTMPSTYFANISSSFFLQEEEALKRIINLKLKDYFDGYDSLTSRYIPSEDLSYWYENDLVIQKQLNQDSKSLEMMKESQLFNQSLLNVGNNLLSLSKELKSIVDKHLKPDHANTTTAKTRLAMSSEAKQDNSITKIKVLQDNDIDDIQLNMQFITNNVLDEVHKSINGCATAAIYAMDSLSNNNNNNISNNKLNEVVDIKKQEQIFYQPLRLGGQLHHRYNHNNNNNNKLENPLTTLVSSNQSSEQLTNYKLQQVQRNELLQFSKSQVDQIYYSVGYLGNCFTVIDQLLQLRFQTQGLAYHEGLVLSDHVESTVTSLDASTINGSINTIKNDISNTENTKVNNIIEIPSTNKLVNQWNAEAKTPTAIFQIGQVIKHKKFGYRGVISGFDQRPTVDMSRWDGIIGLEFGQEQPVYKVIPDENDIEDLFGSGTYRNSYLVAQENIMPYNSTDNAKYIIKHKSMNKHFLGYDPSTKSYRIPHILRYCYPYNTSFSQSSSSTPNLLGSNEVKDREIDIKDRKIDNNLDNQSIEYLEQKIIIEQTKIYHQLDCLLIDVLNTLKDTFSKSRKQIQIQENNNKTDNNIHPINNNPIIAINDLMNLLKHADSFDQALYVENLLWIIWMAHDSIDINRLMRLSSLHAKRGNISKAITMTNQIISLDPTFAEAYNKRASYQLSNQQYNECAQSAKKALELFPSHFGALSGLCLSHERKGEHFAAIEEIRNVLKLHPWAANLPSLLIKLLDSTKKTDD